jgi:short subunit dehydrogenase
MKVAIVTAGGSGMGATAARRLAQDGHKVAILSSSGKGEGLAKELGGIGVTGSNQSTDDLKRLVDQVMGAWGRVDVLVNSAGHGPRDQILKITDEQWHNGLDTYLLNVIRPSRLLAPIMAQQRGGAIIHISTAWTFEPSPMFPTSAVFRAGLAAFAKIFADQYAADNVHKRGDRSYDQFPCLGRRRLHHGAKPASGRRYHPFGLSRQVWLRPRRDCGLLAARRIRIVAPAEGSEVRRNLGLPRLDQSPSPGLQILPAFCGC